MYSLHTALANCRPEELWPIHHVHPSSPVLVHLLLLLQPPGWQMGVHRCSPPQCLTQLQGPQRRLLQRNRRSGCCAGCAALPTSRQATTAASTVLRPRSSFCAPCPQLPTLSHRPSASLTGPPCRCAYIGNVSQAHPCVGVSVRAVWSRCWMCLGHMGVLSHAVANGNVLCPCSRAGHTSSEFLLTLTTEACSVVHRGMCRLSHVSFLLCMAVLCQAKMVGFVRARIHTCGCRGVLPCG